MSRALIAALALAAAAHGEEWHKSFSISGRAELRVVAGDAAVTVRSWAEKNVSVRATAGGEVEIDARQSGDRVELKLKPDGATRLDIRTPADTRLHVETDGGSIQVWDVAGEVRLVSTAGDIEAMAVDGALQVRSARGRIGVRGRYDSLRIDGGQGAIDAGVMPNSTLAGGATVESGAGAVHLRLPPALAANLDVRTRDGELTVDLGVKPERREKRAWRGPLNGGGAPVAVRTRSGGVRIGKL